MSRVPAEVMPEPILESPGVVLLGNKGLAREIGVCTGTVQVPLLIGFGTRQNHLFFDDRHDAESRHVLVQLTLGGEGVHKGKVQIAAADHGQQGGWLAKFQEKGDVRIVFTKR